jgi:hypothetical protein
MSTPLRIQVTPNAVPASYTPPTDMQGLIEAIPQYTSYSLNDTGAVMQVNANAAGADLNGLWVWMLNAAKLPPRLMTGYRNNWWQLYTGMPWELRMFVGYPTGYFDSSGYGIEYSGWEGWALCNGQNGTFNLHNLFITPGYRWDGTWWVTDVTTADTYFNAAGAAFLIEVWHLPLLSLYLNDTDFFKWTSTNAGQAWSVQDPSGVTPGSANTNHATWTYPLDFESLYVNWSISNIPPYVAAGFVQFIGYR